MNWTESDVFRLIELIRRRPCLYDDRHKSFYDEDVKQDNLRELAEIMSSTRPGITVDEVKNIWKEIQANFFKAHLKVKEKKKRGSTFVCYYDKMKFMLNHIPLAQQTQISELENSKGKKARRKNTDNDPKHIKLAISRYNPDPQTPQEALNGDDRDNECNELSRASITAISGDSDSSPQTIAKSKRFQSPVRRPKRSRPDKSFRGNSTVHEYSYFSMTSPHMAVSDSILERTEPIVSESDSFARMPNSSIDLNDSFLKDDEDSLYVKYLLCKLKKLDAPSKMRFKVEIEKMFYQSLSSD